MMTAQWRTMRHGESGWYIAGAGPYPTQAAAVASRCPRCETGPRGTHRSVCDDCYADEKRDPYDEAWDDPQDAQHGVDAPEGSLDRGFE